MCQWPKKHVVAVGPHLDSWMFFHGQYTCNVQALTFYVHQGTAMMVEIGCTNYHGRKSAHADFVQNRITITRADCEAVHHQ